MHNHIPSHLKLKKKTTLPPPPKNGYVVYAPSLMPRKKGFVIPTKSFVKIGITKIFCYNNKKLGSINKTFGCCGEIFGCSKKKIFVVPNFVAVT